MTQAYKAPRVEEALAFLKSARVGLVASDATISPVRNDAVNASKLVPVITGSGGP